MSTQTLAPHGPAPKIPDRLGPTVVTAGFVPALGRTLLRHAYG